MDTMRIVELTKRRVANEELTKIFIAKNKVNYVVFFYIYTKTESLDF
jgi:hypothetical protein